MKNIVILLAAIVPLLIALFIFILGFNDVQDFFPSNNYLNIFSYTDKYDKGQSVIDDLLIVDDYVLMEYSLEAGSPYPLVGLVFQKHDKLLSVPENAIVCVNMDFDAPSLRVGFKIDIPGFSVGNDSLSYLVMETTILKNEKSRNYQIPLNQFKLAQWWSDIHKLTIDWYSVIDYSRVRSIDIIDSFSPLENKQSLKISSIYFKKPVLVYYVILFSVIFLYYLVYFFIFKPWKFLNIRGLLVLIPTSKPGVHLDNGLDEKAQKIISYINQHYNNADLALAHVAEAAAVSPHRVSEILKAEFHLSFKSYLNQIRLEEAKRLLCESDRQITDIAHLLGYNNASHFTRTFKRFIGVSPGEYRKKNTL